MPALGQAERTRRAERGGVKGGTNPAPIPVGPRQWSAGGRETGQFSAEEEILGLKVPGKEIQSWQLLNWALRDTQDLTR